MVLHPCAWSWKPCLGCSIVELANLGFRVVVVEMTNLGFKPLYEHALNLRIKSFHKKEKNLIHHLHTWQSTLELTSKKGCLHDSLD